MSLHPTHSRWFPFLDSPDSGRKLYNQIKGNDWILQDSFQQRLTEFVISLQVARQSLLTQNL